jgi:hypothetical protein
LRGAGRNQLVGAITPGEDQASEDWVPIKRAFDQ